MALIVHKYGGTSMGSTERIRNVAKRVAKWVHAGHQLVVVPSAMSGETNRLLALAKEVSPAKESPQTMRELDMIAATGEQVSVGLLSLALQAEGLEAVSYTGWQVSVRTDSAFTKARIESIDDARVRADLTAGKVVVITGFQGVDDAGNITTLGRGGSDTSAVAIAAAMKAHECLIYTDVDGVYTTDPRVEPDARLGVGAVGLHLDLPAGVAHRLQALGLQGDRQQRRRGLLAGGGQHVEFAVVVGSRAGGRQFLGQAEQAVGLAAHGARDHHHLVAGACPLGNTLGDIADALGRAHRRAAVFMNDQCHG